MLVQFKRIWPAVMALVIFGSSLGWAQSVTGDPADLEFEIINATTDQPGSIDRLLLQYSSSYLSSILDIQPSGSLFEVPAVPILERGKYILTVWKDGVPYYWNLRGRKLLESPVKLHVFDAKTGIDDVAITGLNLLIRKTQSLLKLEYLLQVKNSARPQVSLIGDPHVSLYLPQGVERATLIYGNGPEQEEMLLTDLPGGMVDLPVPLTSGHNKMRLNITMEWQEGLDFPVGSNVPIEAWSLLTTPAGLDIQAFDLVPTDESDSRDHSRFKGPAVAAGEAFRFRVATSPKVGAQEDLFTQSSLEGAGSDAKSTLSGDKKDEDKGFPFVVLTPIFVVLLAIVVRNRRRS